MAEREGKVWWKREGRCGGRGRGRVVEMGGKAQWKVEGRSGGRGREGAVEGGGKVSENITHVLDSLHT